MTYQRRFTSRSFTRRVEARPEDRLPSITGADAIMEHQGDLVVSPEGDIAITTGSDLIIKGLIRRLGTPPSGYRRYVQTANGLQRLDSSYADELYDYLSSPLTKMSAAQMRAALRKAADLDGRVSIIDVQASKYEYASSRITLTITYRVKSSSELSTLNLTV